MTGRVLIIAGSDPSGGAGVQADLKTVTALGGYGAAAVTAVTVQDTARVYGFHPVPPETIRAQIDAVLGDIAADAVKIGMVGGADAARAIAAGLAAAAATFPVVLDPVLAATSGDALAETGLAGVLREVLIPNAVVTPNTDEAATLAGRRVESVDDMRRAGAQILEMGARAVLMKGGHLSGEDVVDLLMTRDGETALRHPRIVGGPFHGTGCTRAAALATGLAQGLDLEAAARRAVDYTRAAMTAASAPGAGARVLNHAHAIPAWPAK